MSNPTSPELPVNALIGHGARPIELRSTITFLDDAARAAFIAHLDLSGAGFATSDDLTAGLASLASSISSTLAGYVTSSTLTSTLSGYVTSSALTSTLSGYVTSSALTSTLAGYVTSSTLTSTLASYATTAALSAAIAALLPSQSGNAGKVLTTNGSTLSWQTPTGGGSSLIRASGTIRGYFDSGVSASPATFVITPGPLGAGETQDFTIIVDGTSSTVTVDNSGGAGEMDANAVCTALVASWSGLNATFTPDGMNNLDVVTDDTGSGASITYGGITNLGGDAVPPSGSVESVELIAALSGKTIKPVQIFFSSATGINTGDGPWNLAFGGGSGTVIFGGTNLAPGEVISITLNPDSIPAFVNGDAGSLVLQFVGAIPVGEDVTCWVIAEQV